MESLPLKYSVTSTVLAPVYSTFESPKEEKDQTTWNGGLIGGLANLCITLPLSILPLVECIVRLALAIIIGLPLLIYELCSYSFKETTCAMLWDTALANLVLFIDAFSSPKENFFRLISSLFITDIFDPD